MAQAAPGAVGSGLGGSQPGATDGSVAAGAPAPGAQAQWPTGDPSSYYSNYWGGKVFMKILWIRLTVMCRILQPTSWPAGH